MPLSLCVPNMRNMEQQKENTALSAEKKILTIEEVTEITGLSKSTLYKMTSARQIPHYKPTTRLLYFLREEVEAWMLRSRIATSEELESEAATYNAIKKGR